MTLEQYFRESIKENKIDHAIRCDDCSHIAQSGLLAFGGDDVHFYIHPDGKSGETLDFIVRGNKLIQV